VSAGGRNRERPDVERTEQRLGVRGRPANRRAGRGAGAAESDREPADLLPTAPRGSRALAMAAQRFLDRLDATPGVPVPASLRARIAASWPLHDWEPRRTRGS
jgi:hypothetical protein